MQEWKNLCGCLGVNTVAVGLEPEPVVSNLRRSGTKPDPLLMVEMMNLNFVGWIVLAGERRITADWAVTKLDDKRATPTTELKYQQVELPGTGATEVWKRTTKTHVAELRHDNLAEG
jgi:hypothetical protein